MMTFQEACQLLKVSKHDSIKRIKQSYRKAARLYHPDANPGAEDIDKFHAVVTAYNVLVEEKKKSLRHTLAEPSRKKPQRSSIRVKVNGSGSAGRANGAGRVTVKPANGSSEVKPSGLLTFDELAIRFDKAPNIWVRIEAAEAIFERFRNRFEAFASERLKNAPGRILVEIIRLLGRLGTDSALRTVASFLTSGDKDVCLAAFIALEKAGSRGHDLLDRHLKTPPAVFYHLAGFFRRNKLERSVLRARLVSSKRTRRLNAVARRTGAPLRDILERAGVPLSRSA